MFKRTSTAMLTVVCMMWTFSFSLRAEFSPKVSVKFASLEVSAPFPCHLAPFAAPSLPRETKPATFGHLETLTHEACPKLGMRVRLIETLLVVWTCNGRAFAFPALSN